MVISSDDAVSDAPTQLVVVRSTANVHCLRDWNLVLTASGISAATAQRGATHLLCVLPEDAERAVRVLAAYDAENPPRFEVEEPPLEPRPADAAFIAVGFILLFHLLSGARDASSPWFASGDAAAARIQAGELWRCVTALTLHADALHALGNAASGGIFLVALGRLIGGGRALLLTLLAGAVATWANTAWRDASYHGVGASTAIFATIGLLAASQINRRTAIARGDWRNWAPIGAALGILAMIGASPTADVIAHLLGLLTGLAMGLLLPFTLRPSETRAADRICSGAALALVVGSWVLARSVGT